MVFNFPAQSIALDAPKLVSKMLSFDTGFSIATRFKPFGIPFWLWLMLIGCYLVRRYSHKFPKFKIEKKEDARIDSINSFYVVTVFVLLGVSFLEYALTEFAKSYAVFYGIALVMGVVLIFKLKEILPWFGFNISTDNRLLHLYPVDAKKVTGIIVLSIPLMLVLTGMSNTLGKQAAPFSTVGITYATGQTENKLMSAFVAPVEDLIMIRLIGFAVAFFMMTMLSWAVIKYKGLRPAKTITDNIITLYNQSPKIMGYVAVISVVFAMTFNAEVVATNFHEENYGRLAPQIADRLGINEAQALTMMKQQVADFWFWGTGVNSVLGTTIGVDAVHAFNNWAVS